MEPLLVSETAKALPSPKPCWSRMSFSTMICPFSDICTIVMLRQYYAIAFGSIEQKRLFSTQPRRLAFSRPDFLEPLAAADDGGAPAVDEDFGGEGARVVIRGHGEPVSPRA